MTGDERVQRGIIQQRRETIAAHTLGEECSFVGGALDGQTRVIYPDVDYFMAYRESYRRDAGNSRVFRLDGSV
jgi:hypothetical protein